MSPASPSALAAWPKLRELGFAPRLALSALVLVFLGGLAASALHLVQHHENRDEAPGVSLTDLRGAYLGVQTTAPLVSALQRGHSDELPAAEREVLLRWLASGRISEDYDNLDLGDAAPAEMLQRSCVTCHSRQAEDELARALPLEYWDDVSKVAFSRRIDPVPVSILAASTHTHALALGTVTLAAAALLLATRWPRSVRHGLTLVVSLSLFADIGAWWAVRAIPSLFLALVAAGAVYLGTLALALLLVLLDLWLPRGN